MVVVRTDFKRSSYTISKHFSTVLYALLRLHSILLITPEPIGDDCNNDRWKPFKGCLGTLDGTYVDVRVAQSDKARYRNQKGRVTVNVLVVCDRNMNFIYLLSGWEGSTLDSRILRDAVTRPHGLQVPNGNYYLVDSGYTNGDGFLGPYRGVRYHLKEFGVGTQSPQNYQEYYNMKHAKARNVIERAFGILESRWAILRSAAYYPIKTQNRIIMGCALLHYFIHTHCDIDPEEANVPDDYCDDEAHTTDGGFVDTVEPSQHWTNFQEEAALSMYHEWRHC